MSGQRFLICGGRNYSDREQLRAVLDGYVMAEMCHGAATGADRMAGDYARENAIPCREFPANWELHGKAAGPIRNQHMLDEFKPQAVIAFPGGRGTADMIRRARAAGLPVEEVRAVG